MNNISLVMSTARSRGYASQTKAFIKDLLIYHNIGQNESFINLRDFVYGINFMFTKDGFYIITDTLAY